MPAVAVSPRIVIADDHELIRGGVRRQLEAAGMRVVGEAGDGQELLDVLRETAADLVVLDVLMPGMDGIDALRRIRTVYPDLKVLILSGYSDPEYVKPVLALGVEGYVLKGCSCDFLVDAVRIALLGEVCLSPLIGRIACAGAPSRCAGEENDPLSCLTKAQRRVARRLRRGKARREIAEDLNLSPKTIDRHVEDMCERLGVSGRAQLVRFLRNCYPCSV